MNTQAHRVRIAFIASCVFACGWAFACGSFDAADDAPAVVPDAGGADGSASDDGGAERDGGKDGKVPSDGCHGRTFGPPRPLTSDITSKQAARAADDGFVYVSWDKSPDNALALATRVNDALTKQTNGRLNLVNLGAPSDEFDPTVAPGSLFLVFGSNRGADAGLKQHLFLSRRSTISEDWGDAVPIAGGGDGGAVIVARPFFANANALYYVEGIQPDVRLRTARLDTTGASLVDATDVAGPFLPVDDNPVVTADELEIFFRRADDVWVASRKSKDVLFEQPSPVPGINSPTAEDYPTWISQDGCELFFMSKRSGTNEVFVTTR